jgi:hypothetical protein
MHLIPRRLEGQASDPMDADPAKLDPAKLDPALAQRILSSPLAVWR